VSFSSWFLQLEVHQRHFILFFCIFAFHSFFFFFFFIHAKVHFNKRPLQGLYGPNGILPVGNVLKTYSNAGTLVEKFSALPTLLWLSDSISLSPFQMMKALTALGAASSLLIVLGFYSSALFFLNWSFYVSIFTTGQTFSSFQWDLLLLETGFV
jgi:hypothetical protein